MSKRVKLFKLVMIFAFSNLCMLLLVALQYERLADIAYRSETFYESVIFNDAIQLKRRAILKEMHKFGYSSAGFDAEKLADLTPDTGGTPVRSVIISNWRSGTSFLGAILNSMPGTYYHYEPLSDFGVTKIRGPPNDTISIVDLKKLLKCDYSDMDEYLKKENSFLFIQNRRFWSNCRQHFQFCLDSKFLTPFCKLFPLHSMKIIRLSLALSGQLLHDTSLNTRILLLVRDPRGIMQSRNRLPWCARYAACRDASYLCDDLVSDYYAAEVLIKKFPTRFRAVRYEDLSISPYDMTENILQFYGLPFDPAVKKFLDTHTKVNTGGTDSTSKESKSAPFHWIKDLKWSEIKDIEKSCTKAMDLWGYRKMISLKEKDEGFDPVLPVPFKRFIMKTK